MVDPYVGAGTTITVAMSCGLSCYGQDINPLAILVSKAKTDFGWADEELIRAFRQVIADAKADNSTDIAIRFHNMEKWFRPDVSIALSKIRRAIMSNEEKRIRRILWVVFASAAIMVFSKLTRTA